MTPDELRRMDNDECIIFEKGVKPVKAHKFYYFKHPMAKKLAEVEISHNDIGEIDRGVWRKYNPYNPYVPEDEEKKNVDNLKVESLDDLFDDEPEEKKEEPKIEMSETVNIAAKAKTTEKELKPKTLSLDLNDFDDEDNSAPILPQGNEQEDDDLYDLQKELEAKFDELFGPLDED